MSFMAFRSAGAPYKAPTRRVGDLVAYPDSAIAYPGQGRLDFTPVKPAPATGEPYESARLWLLARLKQGPVCTLELRREPWPASLNPAQRVLELRNRQFQIKTERREGKTYYRLEGE